MAVQSGLTSNLYVAEYDLSTDIQAFQSETSRNLLSTSGIADGAERRILGRADGSVNWTGYWDTAAAQHHPVISALPTSDRIVSLFIGQTVGGPGGSLPAKVITYAPSFNTDGSLLVNVSAMANAKALEWGEMLTTGKQTFASGTVNGTSVNGGGATAFGLSAYLHVFSLGSGSPTVKLQDSANDSSFSDITGGGFTTVSGATSERIQTATNGAVRQYVRVNVSGTYTNLVAAVTFFRYLVDPNT